MTFQVQIAQNYQDIRCLLFLYVFISDILVQNCKQKTMSDETVRNCLLEKPVAKSASLLTEIEYFLILQMLHLFNVLHKFTEINFEDNSCEEFCKLMLFNQVW